MLERYQRHLYYYRDGKGKPMGFVHQAHHLSHLRAWFRWLCKQNLILFNPASEIELPKLGHRLPKAILSAKEAEKVLSQPKTHEPFGLRDRAMLEVLYSTGIRRSELSSLSLYSMDAERGTLMIRQGKGKKDRLIPIGKRAISWVERYLSEARPKLVINPNETALFLSNYGLAIEPDSLTEFVRKYIDSANIGKRGSCHLFRHTLATLMLEWRGHSLYSSDAWSRQHLDDRDLHAGSDKKAPANPSYDPSSGPTTAQRERIGDRRIELKRRTTQRCVVGIANRATD